MTPQQPIGALSRDEYTAQLGRHGAPACDVLRRRPDWSPARDVTVCECGATLGQHAAKQLARIRTENNR